MLLHHLEVLDLNELRLPLVQLIIVVVILRGAKRRLSRDMEDGRGIGSGVKDSQDLVDLPQAEGMIQHLVVALRANRLSSHSEVLTSHKPQIEVLRGLYSLDAVPEGVSTVPDDFALLAKDGQLVALGEHKSLDGHIEGVEEGVFLVLAEILALSLGAQRQLEIRLSKE